MTIVVTGGAGFIGSAVIRQYIQQTNHTVVNVDKLTYAGTSESLKSVAGHPRYRFEQLDVCDPAGLRRLFAAYRPDAVMHLAAESHVDRSIDGPAAFIETNIVGTSVLLEAAREYWTGLDAAGKQRFRFHHVSTDEVFGALGADGPVHRGNALSPQLPVLREQGGLGSSGTRLAPHLRPAGCHQQLLQQLRALPVPGEAHSPDARFSALDGKPLPVYGEGRQCPRLAVRRRPLRGRCASFSSSGKVGETYNVGGRSERTNLEVVKAICAIVDELSARRPHPAARIAHHVCPGSARPRRALRNRCPQDRARAGVDAGGDVRERFAQDRPVVHRQRRRLAARHVRALRAGAARIESNDHDR